MKRGFTFIELMLVMGIIGVIAGATIPMYRNYQIRNDLDVAAEQVTQALTRSQLLSQSAQGDSTWGFKVSTGTLYKGTAYASRSSAYDENYAFPSTITTSGLSELYFQKISGIPSATGSITLTSNLTGEQRVIDISVNALGVSMNSSDRFTICHQQGGNNGCHEVRIPDNAWPAHMRHGDYIGPCYDDDGDSNTCDHTN